MQHKGLKRQGSLYVLAGLCVVLAAVLVVPRLWPQVVQACTEYTRAFSENFDTVNYKDIAQSSVAAWPSGPITLPRLGSNFVVGAADSLGRRIYTCAAGDFTGDGYPDLIGLDITGEYPVTAGVDWSVLRLIRNLYPSNHGATPLFSVDMSTSYDRFQTHTAPCATTVGDYNKDGLLDFFFMRNSNDEFGYTNFMATMYINRGTATAPSFQAHNVAPNLDFTSRFQTAGIYLYWAANHLYTIDIDNDGDLDILVASQDKIFLLRNPGAGNFNLAAWSLAELAYDARTGFNGVPGTSAVAAADFDGDGDYDVVCGSVGTTAYLAYYENDGTGHYSRAELTIPDATCVGTVGIMANDFTGDGRPDIFVATDEAYRGGAAQARIWFLRNRGLVNGDVDWLFKCLNNCTSPTPSPYDIDMATALDYDRDGDMDAVIADANHSGDYFYIENKLANVFELYGQAQSTNVGVGLLDPRLHAVTRVRVTSLRQGVVGSGTGLAVQLLFSNNGGQSWETYQTFSGAGIANVSNLAWYDFKNFGADLRWRIVLTATEDPMADYQHASFDSPYVDSFAIEFIYVDRREYSRASAAATIITASGLNKKLVIGSSFIFPGWEGQLRAYDMSGVSFVAGTSSELQTIATSNLNDATGRDLIPGAGIYWDAGALLNDRNPDSRTIYTALRSGGTVTNPLVRTSFTRANLGNLATAGTLAWCLKDVNNDNAGLVDFIRGHEPLLEARRHQPLDARRRRPAFGRLRLYGHGLRRFQDGLCLASEGPLRRGQRRHAPLLRRRHRRGALGFHPLQPPAQAQEHVRGRRRQQHALLRSRCLLRRLAGRGRRPDQRRLEDRPHHRPGPRQRQHPRQREHRQRRELLLGPRRHRPDESPAAVGDHAHVQVRQQDLSEHGRDLVDPGHGQGQSLRDDALGGLHGLRLRQRQVRKLQSRPEVLCRPDGHRRVHLTPRPTSRRSIRPASPAPGRPTVTPTSSPPSPARRRPSISTATASPTPSSSATSTADSTAST